MSTNKTPNYQLNQWEPTDQVLREEFNADNAKVDAALAEHAAALTKKGNCSISTWSYTGDGRAGQVKFRYEGIAPRLVLVIGTPGGSYLLSAGGGHTLANSSGQVISLSHSSGIDGNYYFFNTDDPERQFNAKGVYYICVYLHRHM